MILSGPRSAFHLAEAQKFAAGLNYLPLLQSACNWGPVPGRAFGNGKSSKHTFTQGFSQSHWRSEPERLTKLGSMNVKETAMWVEKLASFKGWIEAKTYSQSFESNGISGSTLPLLTVQGLKDGLGIVKLGHRIEIIDAIKSEFTMVDPVVKDLHPMILNQRKWENYTAHVMQQNGKLVASERRTQEAMKWFGQGPRTSSVPASRVVMPREGFRRLYVPQGKNQFQDNMMFSVVACPKKREHNLKFRKRKGVSMVSIIPKIPAIKLPPAKVQVVSKEVAGAIEVKFGPFVTERSSTIISKTKDRKKTVCGDVYTCLDVLSAIIGEESSVE